MELTHQQKGFAQDRIEGIKGPEAYRNNYNCANMSPAAIAVEASRLIHNPKVALMINKATEAVVAELVATSKHTAETLAGEAEFNLQQARLLDQMAPANRAIELIARLTGNLEPSPAGTEVHITKVTVVLPAGFTVPVVIEGQVVPSVEDEDKQP